MLTQPGQTGRGLRGRSTGLEITHLVFRGQVGALLDEELGRGQVVVDRGEVKRGPSLHKVVRHSQAGCGGMRRSWKGSRRIRRARLQNIASRRRKC